MIGLLDGVLKVSVLVALGLVVVSLLRGRSAALRHYVLATAIVCAAGVPMLELVVPSWQVGVVAPSRGQPRASATGDANEVPTRPNEALPSRNARVEAMRIPSTEALVGWTWLAGVLASMGALLVGFARLSWLAGRATRIDSGLWFELAARISREQGLRRPVRLLRSTHPAHLMTWGLFSPNVLLPSTAAAWSEERARIVLHHEIAHVRRRDWATQLVAEIVRSVYWFNPLLWIACRRLRRESELAVDDAVLTQGIDAPDYAEHLLELARAVARQRSWCAAPAMARSSSLERRIAAMLNPDLQRKTVSRSSRLAIGLVVLSVSVAVAGGLLAQGGSSFSTRVSDPSGAPMTETTITLTHQSAGTSHAAPTDQGGYVEFTGLPAGEYTLEARAAGFAPLRDTLTLSAGQRIQRDIKLNVGTVQETITVSTSTSDRPVVTTAKTTRSVDPEALKERFRGKRLQPPMKVRDVRPLYSPALAAAGVEGRVVLEGRIGTDGTMTGIRLVGEAHPDLVALAREAVSQWQFEPTRLWGSPIEVGVTVRVDFKRQP